MKPVEKLTKRDRRALVVESAKKLLQKAIAAGYKLWQPGEVVTMSDRAYLVRDDGSWKRLHPGEELKINGTLYQVRPDGRTFKKVS